MKYNNYWIFNYAWYIVRYVFIFSYRNLQVYNIIKEKSF